MADAGQETGAQDQQQGDANLKGEQGQKADAGQPENREAGENEPGIDPQKIHDSAFAEARRTFEKKEAELRRELEELRSQVKPPKKPESSDTVEAGELEKVRNELTQQLEGERNRVKRAAEGWKMGKLIAALDEAGIANPAYHAQVLQNRVKAGLAEDGSEPFAAEVLTPTGGKALNPKTGEPMGIAELAATFATEHPEFVKGKTRSGVDYGGSGRGAVPRSLNEMSEADRIDYIDKNGLAEYQRLLSESRKRPAA